MTTATLEPADAGPGLFLRFAQALSSRVVAPGDDAELRRQKSILVVAAVLKLACCPVWIVPYALLGHYAAAAAPAAYMCLCVASLLAFMRSKDIAAFRRRQSLSLLTMPALMQWSLGGFEASGGVIYWALLAPLLSLLFQGARESIKWFAAYAAVVVFSSLMPPFLDEPYARAVPHALNLAFFILNIVIVSGIPGDVYAKVIDGGGAGEHRLCFTSVPFQVRAFLRRTVAEAAPAADARAP